VCEKSITNSQLFAKKNEKNVRSPRGGFFLTHTVYKRLAGNIAPRPSYKIIWVPLPLMIYYIVC